MSRITSYISTLIVFLLSCSCCLSQMDVSVKASINRDKIMIGEPVELKLEATMPDSSSATWFPVDSMAHFDLINKGKIDTVSKGDSRVFRQTLLITSFDSGRWVVPSLAFTIGNKDYLTDSLPISVAYSNFDPGQGYHDIKEIIDIENTAVRYINWIVLGMAVLSLIAVIYFLRKKSILPKPAATSKPHLALSPLLEALQAINNLQTRAAKEPLRTKIFHTELNDIFRQYLLRKTGIATMEKTSGELMLQLKQVKMPADDFTSLAQVLRMNDAVKFARYQPAEEENQAAIDTMKKSIEKIDTIISS